MSEANELPEINVEYDSIVRDSKDGKPNLVVELLKPQIKETFGFIVIVTGVSADALKPGDPFRVLLRSVRESRTKPGKYFGFGVKADAQA